MRHGLWARQIGAETLVQRSRYAPGPEWVALDREPRIDDLVQVVAGRAVFLRTEHGRAPGSGEARRAAVAAALPDILLAVADGADLAEEVRKALAKGEEQHGNR